MFVGTKPLPHSLISDFAWLLLYANAFPDVGIIDVKVAVVNSIANAIAAALKALPQVCTLGHSNAKELAF